MLSFITRAFSTLKNTPKRTDDSMRSEFQAELIGTENANPDDFFREKGGAFAGAAIEADYRNWVRLYMSV